MLLTFHLHRHSHYLSKLVVRFTVEGPESVVTMSMRKKLLHTRTCNPNSSTQLLGNPYIARYRKDNSAWMTQLHLAGMHFKCFKALRSPEAIRSDCTAASPMVSGDPTCGLMPSLHVDVVLGRALEADR